MAETMVAKLSSISTMSAASRATSVPDTPIATPMPARLSAGASVTPPLVTGTIFAGPLERGNDGQLVERAGTGGHDHLPQRRLGEPRDGGLGGHRRFTGDDADLARDGLDGQRVIADDDDDANVGLLAALYRLGDFGSRRIVHRDQRDEFVAVRQHLSLHVRGGIDGPAGQGEHPVAAAREFIRAEVVEAAG
jgi:hypothetical protein